MQKFFYQIKIKDEYNSWKEIWTDIESALSKKDLIEKLKNDYQANIVEKISHKAKLPADYRVFATELTPEWESHWLNLRVCKVCNKNYNMLQLKQLNIYGSQEVCSSDCRHLNRRKENVDDYTKSYINQDFRPCVYKITNKTTGLCYIGQTIQCFTLRWYQHFFQSGDTKFHTAIKNSNPDDWSFEVIEILRNEKVSKKELDDREMFWINFYDSINNGYNTAKFVDKK